MGALKEEKRSLDKYLHKESSIDSIDPTNTGPAARPAFY